MKNNTRLIKANVGFAISIFFIIFGIIALMMFDKYKANERAVNQSYRECRLISFSIFTIYAKNSNLIFGEEDESADAKAVFNAFLRTNMLSEIEYIFGPSRISKSKKRGLLLDLWENPYAVTLTKLDGSISINIQSNGPDRIRGTSDDILLRRTY